MKSAECGKLRETRTNEELEAFSFYVRRDRKKQNGFENMCFLGPVFVVAEKNTISVPIAATAF